METPNKAMDKLYNDVKTKMNEILESAKRIEAKLDIEIKKKDLKKLQE